MSESTFKRPGVSDAFLASAGCAHIGDDECARAYGFKVAGIVIPFRDVRGEPIVDGKLPFARVRLYDPSGDQKYLQRRGSGVHILVPLNFTNLPKCSTLFLVEGEFKALALAEAGYAALGLCGITGAVRTDTNDEGGRHHVLNDELAKLIEFHRPARVVFLGDADVVLNAQFASEAAKLRKLLWGTRRFSSVQTLLVAKAPVDGPKGIDDCRENQGEGFKEWFDRLVAGALEVPAKATASEVFCDLLRREQKQVRALMAAAGHEPRRARTKLLQGAAQLWSEPGAKLDLKPLLADLLAVKEIEVAGLVKDAASDRHAKASVETTTGKPQNPQGTKLELPDVEPWEQSINGAVLLDEVRAVFRRFVVASEAALTTCALFALHTYSFDLGEISPILFITGPTKRCGKSRLLSVLILLVNRPLAASSASAAGIYRAIELHRPTLLIDEVDAFLKADEQLRGLVNSGHTRQAAYHLGCVKAGDEIEPRRWSTWAPKAFSGIGRLADTIEDRAFIIIMRRRRQDEATERLRYNTQFEDSRRKCARFVADNAEAIRAANPAIPEGLNDRAADNWTPLLALADLAGGDWPTLARQAAQELSGNEGAEALGLNAQVLADIRRLFSEAGTDKLASKELCTRLADLEGRPWAEFGRAGKPISQNQLANLLREFEITSRGVRIGDTTPKGYTLDDFADSFSRYLPTNHAPECNSATKPANVDENPLFENATPKTCCTSENVSSPNNDAACCGVAFPDAESCPERELAAKADII